MGWVTDRHAEMEAQRDEVGDLAPPWAAYPEIERFSMGWRMGHGESWIVLWHLFLEDLATDRETRLAYLQRHTPIPYSWAENAFGVLVPRTLEYGQVDRSEPASIAALHQLGLLGEDASYVWWLRRHEEVQWPWTGDQDPATAARVGARAFGFWSRRIAALRAEVSEDDSSDMDWLMRVAAAWKGAASAEVPEVPEAWRELLPVLRSGVLPEELDLSKGLHTLATMLCAGKVVPPWKFGLTIDAAEQDFGEDMGFADAFFLWVMSAFDDAHGLEAYLRAHDAPEAWFDQVTPMFESWRAPGT